MRSSLLIDIPSTTYCFQATAWQDGSYSHGFLSMTVGMKSSTPSTVAWVLKQGQLTLDAIAHSIVRQSSIAWSQASLGFLYCPLNHYQLQADRLKALVLRPRMLLTGLAPLLRLVKKNHNRATIFEQFDDHSVSCISIAERMHEPTGCFCSYQSTQILY